MIICCNPLEILVFCTLFSYMSLAYILLTNFLCRKFNIVLEFEDHIDMELPGNDSCGRLAVTKLLPPQ